MTVSQSAARRIRKIIEAQEGQAAGGQAAGGKTDLRLRVSVSGGGCSGFQYHFNLDATREEGDVEIERDGALVVVDAMSLEFVAGATLDFVENLTGSYFRVDNPNAASSCGCGTSFSI